ncbi:glycine cleavage system protein GcvH [Marinobacterium lutimaris]|uniref:Glycine cleavage system H protein n=1 Tax=Marinobacterium lutimaris TaxID=568106 RepID=A0A1H6C743_9GAMM|nr:glycine cleavage system protein GcvH [Marinobacterium lutimaris]SEG68547.1 glycine cleavage system H protein [Marinobacterium lutimaris]
MSDLPTDLKYASSHEWVRDNGDGTVTVGISDFAQEQLGDVVFVELPEVGREVEAGEEFSVVESVKAASDIYAPVGGEVIEANEQLDDSPELINESPFGDGWICKIRMSDAAELAKLMDAEAYAKAVSEG